jgi:hypothetical protein
MFHAVGDESHGYQKEENGWNEGKADERRYQFGSEFGTQDFSLSLKDQFNEIPNHQKDQEENQDDVDVNQAEDDDIVGDRDLPSDLGEFHLNGGKDKDEDGDDPNDDQLIASSSCIRRKCFFHTSSPSRLLGRKRFDIPIGFKIPQGDEKEKIV